MLMLDLPITPGAIIGYTRRGPIRLLAGGSGEGDGGEGTATDGGPEDGSQPETPPAKTTDDAPQDGGDIAEQLHRAQEELKKVRGEAAKARTNAKATAAEQARTDVVQQIAKALGLAKDDAPADPAKLAEQLAASQKEGQQARVELAVYKAASKHNADADALLDSRAFVSGLDGIDPTDGKKIGDLIKKALDDNPRYRSGQAPAARGGTEPTGRPGGKKAADLTEAVTARLTSQAKT